jgi:hypothetical protein
LRAARSRRGLISITSMTLLVLLASTLPGSKSARAQTSEPTTEQLQKEPRNSFKRKSGSGTRSSEAWFGGLKSWSGKSGRALRPVRAQLQPQRDRRQDHSLQRGLRRRRSPPWRQRSRRLHQRGQAHPRRRRRVRHRRRRAPTHQRPGSSRSARRPRNGLLNGRLSPPATYWCRKVLPKSNRYSATRAARIPPKSFLM